MIAECLEPSLCELIVSSFEGDIVDGKYGGYGSLVLDNGNVYDGEFCNGLFHGKGINAVVFVWFMIANSFICRDIHLG